MSATKVKTSETAKYYKKGKWIRKCCDLDDCTITEAEARWNADLADAAIHKEKSANGVPASVVPPTCRHVCRQRL